MALFIKVCIATIVFLSGRCNQQYVIDETRIEVFLERLFKIILYFGTKAVQQSQIILTCESI